MSYRCEVETLGRLSGEGCGLGRQQKESGRQEQSGNTLLEGENKTRKKYMDL